jgi:hypothetical protein
VAGIEMSTAWLEAGEWHLGERSYGHPDAV